LIARITGDSAASLHLHRSAGFVHVGRLREVGRKFGRLLDVHVLQLVLDQPTALASRRRRIFRGPKKKNPAVGTPGQTLVVIGVYGFKYAA
jgi:hypothetical protein